MRIRDLIDKARDETGANYTEIAARLNRSKQLVSNWRSGAKVPEDADIIALARMAKDRPEPWLATAQAARTHGEARDRWEAIAKHLGAAAAVVLAVALPWPVQAAITPQAEQPSLSTLCEINDRLPLGREERSRPVHVLNRCCLPREDPARILCMPSPGTFAGTSGPALSSGPGERGRDSWMPSASISSHRCGGTNAA